MEKSAADEFQDPKLKAFQDQLNLQKKYQYGKTAGNLYGYTKEVLCRGRGHLVGNRSILALLQEKRYQIDQLVVRERAN
jgi:uncharacterized protein YbaP (TraB family)